MEWSSSAGRDALCCSGIPDSNVGMMVAMSDEMVKALEQERKARKLESIPEAVRAVLGEYFKTKENK